MRIIHGLLSFFIGVLLIVFLIRAGMDVPDWAACLSLMIAFAGGCAGGD